MPSHRLESHFLGPYKITRTEEGGNVAYLEHYLQKGVERGPIHVSRLVKFNNKRFNPAVANEFQLDVGYGVVEDVLDHYETDNGSTEFLVKFEDEEIPRMVPWSELKKVDKVKEYVSHRGLDPKTVPPPAPATSRYGRTLKSSQQYDA